MVRGKGSERRLLRFLEEPLELSLFFPTGKLWNSSNGVELHWEAGTRLRGTPPQPQACVSHLRRKYTPLSYPYLCVFFCFSPFFFTWKWIKDVKLSL